MDKALVYRRDVDWNTAARRDAARRAEAKRQAGRRIDTEHRIERCMTMRHQEAAIRAAMAAIEAASGEATATEAPCNRDTAAVAT
jgi:hypothetical protein